MYIHKHSGGRDIHRDQSSLDRDDFREKGGIQIGPGRKVLRPNKEKGGESLVSLPQPSASVGINEKVLMVWKDVNAGAAVYAFLTQI